MARPIPESAPVIKATCSTGVYRGSVLGTVVFGFDAVYDRTTLRNKTIQLSSFCDDVLPLGTPPCS